MVTHSGPWNIYQTFHDFGLVLWLSLLPHRDVECCIDPPFCLALFPSFHCVCFSKRCIRWLGGSLLNMKDWLWRIFFYLPKSIAFLLKLIIIFQPDGFLYFCLIFFFFRGIVWGGSFIPRGTQHILYWHWRLLKLADALTDFPSYKNAHETDHLEKLKEKSHLKNKEVQHLSYENEETKAQNELRNLIEVKQLVNSKNGTKTYTSVDD